MLSNGADVPLASKEGAAEEGPPRGAGGGEGQEGLQAQSRDPPQAALERPHWSRDTPGAQGRACAGTGEMEKEGGTARRGWEGPTTAHLHPYAPWCHGGKGGNV